MRQHHLPDGYTSTSGTTATDTAHTVSTTPLAHSPPRPSTSTFDSTASHLSPAGHIPRSIAGIAASLEPTLKHIITSPDLCSRPTTIKHCSSPDSPSSTVTPALDTPLSDRPNHALATSTPNILTPQQDHRRTSFSSRSPNTAIGLRVNTSIPALTTTPTMAETDSHSVIHDDRIPSRGRNIPAQSGSPITSYFSARSLEQRTPISPASVSLLPSPALSAMIDITPLPSPQFIDELSPRRHPSLRHRGSRATSAASQYAPLDALPSRSNSVRSPKSPSRKQKTYNSLISAAVQNQNEALQSEILDNKDKHDLSGSSTADQQPHDRSRSVSDFVPEALCNIRQRVATFGPSALDSLDTAAANDNHQPVLHREENLSAKRGFSKLSNSDPATKTLPSPPDSSTGIAGGEHEDGDASHRPEPGVEYFVMDDADPSSGRKRHWRAIKQLGQGTFSKVLLATEDRSRTDPEQLDPNKLVAIKIIEHGPAGGADEDRIKHSLSREVDILKTMRHPSLVHLIAMQEQTTRTCLVLPYCRGGDLFEFASEHKDFLTCNLVQRLFAELVSAVHYLHQNWIVHRDIKLENVLVNVPALQLDPSKLPQPQSYPHPLVTLTDLGLSRRIAPPPASPLLSTRCGSEDYAAPEILLGQAYDGRSTDAWALGALLYALMEGRLPFDAPPRKPDRSRNTHRIARCDWIWCRFGDDSGEWIGDSTPKPTATTVAQQPQNVDGRVDGGMNGTLFGSGSDSTETWEGARICVEALLKKVRMGRKSLDDLIGWDYVKQGMRVPGGLTLPAQTA